MKLCGKQHHLQFDAKVLRNFLQRGNYMGHPTGEIIVRLV